MYDDTQADVTVSDVLDHVYKLSVIFEEEDSHYFSVQLDGVDTNSRLLSYADVEDYLSQNAPVSYSPEFVWGREITNRLKNAGVMIDSYNVILEYGSSSTTIFKPYRDEFVIDKTRGTKDTIHDIEIVKITDEQEKITAIGWLAKTNYRGSIPDKAIKGIRLRKGNILVGDCQTLNSVFKDSRFNGWAMGELFVLDNLLIPNARRDNFEKNSEYFRLYEYLTKLAAEITRDIRNASLKRNDKLSMAISQSDKIVEQATVAVEQGVSEKQKNLMMKKLEEAQEDISSSNISEASETYYQDIAFAELDMLIGKIKGTTKYKAINTIDSLSSTEKKILERVIDIVEKSDINNADKVIETIISGFAQIT